MKKLAIITTHPIQYNAPLFRMLTERKNFTVRIFYTWSQSVAGKKFDPGFGQDIEWDIPLLKGYEHSFVNNISAQPGSHHYNGINNPTLINEIQDWGANALLVYGWSFKSHWACIRFFTKKIPVFFRGDSTLLDEKKGLKQMLRKIFLRYVYANIDVALYTGIANKDYFKAMGLKEEQLVFMPHAIDNNRFAANDLNKNAASDFRHSLNIPPEATVFLFAGKLEKKKQPDLLLECFASLKAAKTFLIIAGSGALEEYLRNVYSSHLNIKFIGFQNQQQMPAIYNACDVFVLPSKGPNETWGLAINEAMAAGKAIIASDKCGASYDLVKNNKSGFVFESGDAISLKAALKFFLNNKREAIVMGKASMDIIKQYSFQQDCIAIERSIKVAGEKYIK